MGSSFNLWRASGGEYFRMAIDTLSPGGQTPADQPPLWPGYGVELFDCDGNSYDAIYWYDFLDAPLMIQGCTECDDGPLSYLCSEVIANEAYLKAFAYHLPEAARDSLFRLSGVTAQNAQNGAQNARAQMAADVFRKLVDLLL